MKMIIVIFDYKKKFIILANSLMCCIKYNFIMKMYGLVPWTIIISKEY